MAEYNVTVTITLTVPKVEAPTEAEAKAMVKKDAETRFGNGWSVAVEV